MNDAKYKNKKTGSQHARTHNFFICANIFVKIENDRSFNKFTLKTFKGVSNFLKNIDKTYLFNFIKLKKSLKPVKNYTDLNRIHSSLLSSSEIIIQNEKFNKSLYKLSKLSNIIDNLSNLTLSWYSKIHNTTHNIKKTNIVLFLRTARHFNKGRYSRNRQLYRTGVY